MAGWLWLWLCLGLSPSAISHRRSFRLYINELDLKVLAKDLFEELNCKLIESRFLNCNMIVRRNVDQVSVLATLDLLKPNNQTMRLYNVHLDGCQFLDTVHKSPLFNAFAKSLANSIKGSLKCPIIAHFNYTLNNWHLKDSDFLSFLPECRFRAVTKYYNNNKSSLFITFGGKVVYKK